MPSVGSILASPVFSCQLALDSTNDVAPYKSAVFVALESHKQRTFIMTCCTCYFLKSYTHLQHTKTKVPMYSQQEEENA